MFDGGMSWLVLCAEVAAPVDKNSVIESYFEILYLFSSTAAMTTSGFASVMRINPRDSKTALGHLLEQANGATFPTKCPLLHCVQRL